MQDTDNIVVTETSDTTDVFSLANEWYSILLSSCSVRAQNVLSAFQSGFPTSSDFFNALLCETSSSKLARATHVDMMNKVQINIYAAGLHRQGSGAVTHYTMLELADRFKLMNLAFDQEDYRVDKNLEVI